MPDTRRATETVTLAPLDNRALANLCGPLDVNLRQIEAACDVAITHRGDAFTIAGAPDRAAQAKAALERFYAAAEKPLSVDDIQLGLVEIGTGGAVSEATLADANGEGGPRDVGHATGGTGDPWTTTLASLRAG